MEKTIFEKLSNDTDCFDLYSQECFVRPMVDMMARQGVLLYTLTRAHHKVLSPLDYLFRGQWVSMKELAAYAKSDRGNLSRAIYELEEMELIEIQTDKNDRRVKHIRLTEKGEQICDEGNRRAIELSEVYFQKYLTDSELEDMHRCLSKVNEYWQKLQPKEFFGEE